MSQPLHKLPGSSSLSGLIQGNGTSQATSLKTNLNASVNPTINDDSSEGYAIGSIWVNTSLNTFYLCTSNSLGNANWSSGGGSAGSPPFTITATNSFTTGQVILFNGTSYALAKADNASDAEVIGIVQTATSSVFTFINSGFLTWNSHGFTKGNVLFLSPTTAGLLQASDVSTVGQVSKPIAIVLDANNIAIDIQRGFSVGADSTAKNDKTYITQGNESATLANSRQLTVSSGIVEVDSGAGSTLNLSLDVHGLSAAVTLSETDEFPEWNASATGNKKIAVPALRGLIIGSAQGTIASGTTTDLSTVTNDYIQVTGTTAITAFGTPRAGVRKILEFAGILTLTYNATSLIIPGAANVTTAAGDVCEVVHEGSGNWRVLSYQPASGLSLVTASVPINRQTITSSTTFTPVTKAIMVVLCAAGGGGGGGGSGNSFSAGGGSGGSGAFIIQNLTPGAGITVTVGAVGGGGGTNAAGGSGGNTTFGTYITATGGRGGSSVSTGVGGLGGTISAFDITNVIPLQPMFAAFLSLHSAQGTAVISGAAGTGAPSYFNATATPVGSAGTLGRGGAGGNGGNGTAGGAANIVVSW